MTAMTDKQILDLWSPRLDSEVQRPILGKNKIIAFARACMAPLQERADALEEALSHFAAIDLKRADVPADFAWHVLNARALINPTGGES